MNLCIQHFRKIQMSGLVLLFFVLSGCSSGAQTPASQPITAEAAPGTQAQTLLVKQAAIVVGPNDPWTLIYKGVTVKIVSTDQQSSFADDPDPTVRANWLFRINFQVTNPYKTQADLYWDRGWRLQSNGKTHVPVNFKQGMSQPGTTNNWLDFPLDAKISLQTAKLIVGAFDDLRITTGLARPGDLQAYRTKSITSSTSFEYGNSEWVIEKITSSTSITVSDGSGGWQAQTNSRYLTFQMKVRQKNNGIDAHTWKLFSEGMVDGLRLMTKLDTRDPQNGEGTLPALLDQDTGLLDGTLVFQAVVDENGIPGASPTSMTLLFPSSPSLHIGAVSIIFAI